MSFRQGAETVTSSTDTLELPLPSGDYEFEITHAEPKLRELSSLDLDKRTKDGINNWVDNSALATQADGDSIEYLFVRIAPLKAFPDDDAELEAVPNWKDKSENFSFFTGESLRTEFLGQLLPAAGIDLDAFIAEKKKAKAWDEKKGGLAQHLDELFRLVVKKRVLVNIQRKWNDKAGRYYSNIKKIGPIT